MARGDIAHADAIAAHILFGDLDGHLFGQACLDIDRGDFGNGGGQFVADLAGDTLQLTPVDIAMQGNACDLAARLPLRHARLEGFHRQVVDGVHLQFYPRRGIPWDQPWSCPRY